MGFSAFAYPTYGVHACCGVNTIYSDRQHNSRTKFDRRPNGWAPFFEEATIFPGDRTDACQTLTYFFKLFPAYGSANLNVVIFPRSFVALSAS
jgi:hypothetical protein